MPAATKAAKAELFVQYQADFAGSRDPYGNRWTYRLYDTGALANPQITISGASIKIRPVKYWVFHQIGSHGLHPNKVLPFGPSNWDYPTQAKIADVVIAHFK